PFYRAYYEQHGFDARRMRRLKWKDFLQLPTVGKVETRPVAHQDLLDGTVPVPAGDGFTGRSSGSTGEPVVWPGDWQQFYLIRAYFETLLRRVEGHRTRTAVMCMMALDRNDLASHAIYRAFYSLKEHTGWPFEVFVTGEDAELGVSLLRWVVQQQYE